MPPLRQAPTLIFPGGNVIDDFRGPSAAPHDHVAHVTTRISLRSFFLLLVGTVVIFGLTILVWHLGSFFRRFSKAKIVGEKVGGPKRYAKTWHGWVDLEKYQDRQRRKGKWANRVLVMIGLKKPNAKEQSIWVDEKQPSDVSEHGYADAGTVVRNQSGETTAPFMIDIDELIRPIRNRVYRPTFNPSQEDLNSSVGLPSPAKPNLNYLRSPLTAVVNNRPNSHYGAIDGHDKEHSYAGNSAHSQSSVERVSMRKQSQSMPSLITERDSTSSIRAHSVKTHASESDQEALKHETTAVIPRKRPLMASRAKRRLNPAANTSNVLRLRCRTAESLFALARQYQVWGAKMQLEPSEKDPPYLMGLAGRPGTPAPAELRTMIRSAKEHMTMYGCHYEIMHPRPERSVYYRLPDNTLQIPPSGTQAGITQSNVALPDLGLLGDANMDMESAAQSRRQDKGKARESPSQVMVASQQSSITKRRRSSDPAKMAKNLVRSLSTAEVHLLYYLSKRLEWLCGELEPYRRPAQYLLIFNHWLNKKTWYVYDAPGRVPLPRRVEIELKRKGKKLEEIGAHQQEAEVEAKPERVQQSSSTRRRRFESWRTAVNIARRFSGAETLNKQIKTLETSEGPTDGVMDPASWIIRRPPQGYDVAPPAESWFEGTGGVLETYENWQRIGKSKTMRVKRFFSHGLLMGDKLVVLKHDDQRPKVTEKENRRSEKRNHLSSQATDIFSRVRRESGRRFKRASSGIGWRRRISSPFARSNDSADRTGDTLVASIGGIALSEHSSNLRRCRTVEEMNENRRC
ncbi:hypothetical protein KEM54_003565 [Ascosphaera aggregata]|nr:hypothetical protein KEM54_003565 [Ascosphaera aggregata]